jgi:choline kinase
MKAIILSAGQGKRLLPLTAECPKCILPIRGQPLIEWQIDELISCGIDRVTVVVGYRADKVEKLICRRYGHQKVQTLYNAAYAKTDNLVSCWAARNEMNEDFVLLNGDTLFEAAVLQRLLSEPGRPVTVVIHHKNEYDADDMKVELNGCRLAQIGKDLAPEKVDGESIGMILFRGKGPVLFRRAIINALRNPSSARKWYLSVINEMAQEMPVWTCSIQGLQWCEVDCPADFKQAEKVVNVCAARRDIKNVAATHQRKERFMV